MEKIINIHVEKLPEGVYLATADDVQGRTGTPPRAIRTLKRWRLPGMWPVDIDTKTISEVIT